MLCLCWEGVMDVTSSLDDSISSLPYRHRGHTPNPAALLPVIAAPVVATRTSRTSLPSTVCRPMQIMYRSLCGRPRLILLVV